MDSHLGFAGQTVLLSDTRATGPAYVVRIFAGDEPMGAVSTSLRNRAERPSPIPHYAPVPTGGISLPRTTA